MDSTDRDNPSRRQVIATAGAAGLAAGIDALVGSAAAQTGKKPHVIIVGAGLSGLCAAYRLQKEGWTYTILEAERQHIGGRVRTMYDDSRAKDVSGRYWEAGAMRIPKEHNLTRDYCRLFDLELRPFVMYSSKTFYYGRQTRSTTDEDIKKKFKLTREEQALSSSKLWDLGVKDIATGKAKFEPFTSPLSNEELEELRTANVFTSPKLVALDRVSLRQMFQRAKLGDKPLSDEAIEFVLFSYGNLAIQHGASTEFLREENIGVWDPGFSEIKGGSSRLPNAFLNELTSKPKMGCEVVRLEQDKGRGRVRAVYRQGQSLAKEEGDYLICTIPFPILGRVETDPPFSDEKRRAILELGYDSGTKVAVRAKYRFWEKNNGIYGGASTTDLTTGAIIYPSDNALDEKGEQPRDPAVSDRPGWFLPCYTWGQDARRLGAMAPSEREKFVINHVAQVHPELREPGMILQQNSWAWDSYKWCGGAFAFYQPGQFARMHQTVVAPEGRIYFAGEHCSHSHSWMQGALESAENAVKGLLDAAG